MSLLWVLIIAVVIAAAIVHRRYRHRIRYVDTPAWKQEHWEEEHERDKLAQRRKLEGL
jgi:hypothetical protein